MQSDDFEQYGTATGQENDITSLLAERWVLVGSMTSGDRPYIIPRGGGGYCLAFDASGTAIGCYLPDAKTDDTAPTPIELHSCVPIRCQANPYGSIPAAEAATH